ncbi:hypothetical protein BDP81DRAFT_435018 [Colletotrichum phormii]|uniref:Secreted protein n=1 Tax=Colletotrichum phormii TaxID=359342 RepID=A0AAI9ZJ80_9PEZI|nr:uncharacterized protein BDP81DRAFT_435018 [Colletotrichum phormii]KAK1625595.1 hypothetical protein BDP81DRAFT_435018 [Colletotrichum phormii]
MICAANDVWLLVMMGRAQSCVCVSVVAFAAWRLQGEVALLGHCEVLLGRKTKLRTLSVGTPAMSFHGVQM